MSQKSSPMTNTDADTHTHRTWYFTSSCFSFACTLTYLSHIFPFYSLTIPSFFCTCDSSVTMQAGWQRTEAAVSQRQLSADMVLTEWRVRKKKKLSSKASDWNHPSKIAQIKPGRETQTVCEKGAGGSRDERRQASQQSTTPLTSVQLDPCFYRHRLKSKANTSERERFIWRRH